MNRSHWLLLSIVCIVSAFVALGCPGYAGAQSITFSPAEKSIGLPASVSPGGQEGFAADASGNFFIIDEHTGSSQVIKLSPGGAVTTVGTGISDPQTIKVDPAGNVYIEDPSVNKLFKVTPAGVQTVVPIQVFDLGFDSAGNLYFSDAVDGFLKKFSTSGVLSVIEKNFTAGNLAVDPNGNVFTVDSNNRLVKVTPSGAETVIATGLSCCVGVALDSADNVYLGPILNSLTKISPSGVQTTILSNLGSDDSPVVVDKQGNIFILQQQRGILELQNTTVATGFLEFSNTDSSLTQPVQFSFHATVAVNGVRLLTEGALNQDFQSTTGTTCRAQTYTSGQTCIVNVRFLPTKAGLRAGALVLVDSAGNALSTVNLFGVGFLPEVAMDPGVLSPVLASGLKDPSAVAFDGLGNTYIVDKGNNRVLKLSTGGVLSTIGSGLSSPTGVTVDGLGNVYISDTANDRVVKVGPGGQQSTVLTSLNTPDGLAVDGAGNLYVADSGNDRILKLAADGVTQSTVGSGFARPTGVSADAQGDIFVADFGNSQVVEVSPNGSQTTVASGLSGPAGVALDARGDVYIVEAGANDVLELVASGSKLVVVGSGLSFPFDAVLMAVNGAGDVFIADTLNNRILLMNRAHSSLNFGAVTVGQSAAQTVNITATSSTFASGAFSVTLDANDPNFQLGGTCIVLAQDVGVFDDCDLTVTFSPQTKGTINGTVTVVTDAGTQTISLTGNGN